MLFTLGIGWQTVVADEGVPQEAPRALPRSSGPHPHAHLVPEEVVRLTEAPVPVVGLLLSIVTAVRKGPPPAGGIVVQPDPGLPRGAPSSVQQPLHVLCVGDGGQVGVMLPAVRLGPGPGQGRGDEVVLMREAADRSTQPCGWTTGNSQQRAAVFFVSEPAGEK